MTDASQVTTTLNRMMSHGIFDAEVIASELRLLGWAFNWGEQNVNENGGVYFVRTPEGRQGYVQWYDKDSIVQVAENAGFFLQDTAPRKLFVGWVLADQLGRIILGHGFDENGEMPGEVFRNAYSEFSGGGAVEAAERVVIPATPEPEAEPEAAPTAMPTIEDLKATAEALGIPFPLPADQPLPGEQV